MVRSSCKSCGEVLTHDDDDVPPSGIVVECPKCKNSVTVVPVGAAGLTGVGEVLDLDDSDLLELGSSLAPVAQKASGGIDLPAPVSRTPLSPLGNLPKPVVPKPVVSKAVPNLPSTPSVIDLPVPVKRSSIPNLPIPVKAQKQVPNLPRPVKQKPIPPSKAGLSNPAPGAASDLLRPVPTQTPDLPVPVVTPLEIPDLPAPVAALDLLAPLPTESNDQLICGRFHRLQIQHIRPSRSNTWALGR